MDATALQFESRFSLPPNSLGYCGRNTAAGKFKKCIKTGVCAGVEKEVSKFIVLHPYLKLMSAISGKQRFSYDVFESYWLGNDLLKKAKPEHYDLLLKYFLEQGVPDFFVEELRKKRPKAFIPSHLFQVLYIGVGKASGAVPFNLESINNCMIRWGKVEEIKDQRSKIKINSLKNYYDKYKLTTVSETIRFDPLLVPELKIGDTVAVHWGMIIKILGDNEAKKLDYWTKKVIENIKYT